MLTLEDLYLGCSYLTLDNKPVICKLISFTDECNIEIQYGNEKDVITIWDIKGAEPTNRFFYSRCDEHESLGNDIIWKFNKRKNPFTIYRRNGGLYYSNGIIEKRNESPIPFNYIHELQTGHQSFYSEIINFNI